jgi:GNAT superfamily N-acetyltransferase
MLRLRPATREDVPTILQLIRDLAEYERDPQAAVATADDIVRDVFGDPPACHVVMADWDGQPAGFALFFYNYSTWQGRRGLYLEDLFVRPEFRGRHIGKALMVHLARRAVAEGCVRYQWQVLDWNTPAIGFYESLGARIMDGWLTVRIDGEALEALAATTVEGLPG